jgi:hypothetical protein
LKVHDGHPPGWFRRTVEGERKQLEAPVLTANGRLPLFGNVRGVLASVPLAVGSLSKRAIGSNDVI